jgi:hypothetical protein
MLFSQVLLNGWITCTHYSWGPHIFQKSWDHFRNLGLRRVTKEIHNLNFRHCLGVLVHMIWKYLHNGCHLTRNCNLTFICGDTWNAQPTCFGGCTHWNPDSLWNQLNMTFWVSKFIAWYQKYGHIKAWLANIYTHSLEAGQDDVYTCTW